MTACIVQLDVACYSVRHGFVGTELKGEESGSDGEGVDIPIENNTWDQKAAYLQEQLAAHPDLKLTSALGKVVPV